MCVPSLRFAFVPLSNLTASIAFRVIGILKFQVIVFWRIWGGLLVWVFWQIYSNCSGSCGKGGGRFVAWFWAWFWNCLLTPWTFDSSGHIIGATCLPSTARSDNSFDKFVLSIVLSSLADLDRYGTGIWCPVQGPCGSRQRNCVSVDGDGVLG